MKVKDLLEILQNHDMNLEVVGVNSIETGFVDKTEVVCTKHSYGIKVIGQELAVIIK